MEARYRRACVGYARLREQIIKQKIREGEEDPVVTRLDTWKYARMNGEHDDDPTALQVLEDVVRITQQLEEDELNDIKLGDLLDRAIPLEYSGRVRGCGWGVTKKSLAQAPELSEMSKLKRQCNRLEKDMQEMKAKGYQPTVPSSCGSSHKDNFNVDDDDMNSDDDLDFPDEVPNEVLPEGPIRCYLYVENPRRHVGQGILHNRPNEILHGVPLPEGYARIQFEVAVESEKHSAVSQCTDEVRTVGETVGHFISWPKKLVSLRIECPPLKNKKMDKRNDANKPIMKSVESTVCAKPLGYPKCGDSPHNSMVLHILRFLPSNIMNDGIEVPMTAYFDGEPWNECIVHEYVVEILKDRWLRASSIAFYIRYLGEVYISENVELAGKFSFVSPHITPMLGNGTSSNHLAECLLKHTGKDHLLLVPHNVGQHWVLIGINTKTDMIYFMDPAPSTKIAQRVDLKNFVESALRSYRTRRGGSITKAAMNRFNWANIQCPKQIEMDGIHCGHYICCYIEDLLNSGDTSIPVYFVHKQPVKFYSPKKMENFVINWSGYLYNRFLKEKMES